MPGAKEEPLVLGGPHLVVGLTAGDHLNPTTKNSSRRKVTWAHEKREKESLREDEEPGGLGLEGGEESAGLHGCRQL